MHGKIRKLKCLFVLTVVILSQSLLSAAQAPKRIAIRAARLLDVKSGIIVNNPVILIEGERIAEVGPNLPIPKDSEVLNLGNVTLMPGLIDAHTHLLQNYDSK